MPAFQANSPTAPRKTRPFASCFWWKGKARGGTAKQGRDRRTQAILPLRGKVLNVEKHRLDKVLSNEEIRAIVTALGTGIWVEDGKHRRRGESAETGFDLNKRRYDRIIIMTDADVDGSHIRTLLLTFLFRYLRPFVENGHVYIAKPPLYLIRKGREVHYAFTDEERDELVRKLGRGVIVQRFKGLGEMNPNQLAETTMDPKKRVLVKVNLDDAPQSRRTLHHPHGRTSRTPPQILGATRQRSRRRTGHLNGSE
jgi:DNA gyrase subunit B